ncbi:prolipoprotein diacylglyceryl transferase [Solibaculum mannosilyticum]|uniref:prolipoprotein diacylglyceryl transferase n=1 Tax=Solibaculum mannosilyticum TaxID=2780922 RepID=UPI0034B51E53
MESTISFPNLGDGLTFTIDRVAFSFNLFGQQVDIYWYGILIALGMILAVVYAMRNAKRLDVNSDRLLDVILGGIIGGIIGARLYYVLFNLSDFTSFADVFNVKQGGLAIYGGLIGGLLVGGLICKWRKVSFFSVCDLAAVGFLIGQGIGRWGNFINQEAFGTNTDLPWGMTGDHISSYLYTNTQWLADHGVDVDFTQPVHPCFLYESIWCLIGVILLHLLSKRRRYKGQVFVGYVVWYGIGRFFIEGLRTDSLYIGSSNIRISQLLSGLVVIAAVIAHFIIMSKVKERESEDPNYVPVFGTVEQGGSLEDLRLAAAKQRALASSLTEEAQSLREQAAQLEKQEMEEAQKAASQDEPDQEVPDSEEASAKEEVPSQADEGQPKETSEQLIQKAEEAEKKAEEASEEASRLEQEAAKVQRQREASSLIAKASDLEKEAQSLKETAKTLRESREEGAEEKAQEAEAKAVQLEKEAKDYRRVAQKQNDEGDEVEDAAPVQKDNEEGEDING